MTGGVVGSRSVRDHLSVGLVVIGNEILSGKVIDTNTPFLAHELRGLGASLERVVVIPDDIPQIAAEVADFSRRFDVVFTSGGVGPTHDDMTMDGVAAAFGRPLVEHIDLRRAIERFVGNRANAAHLKMAQIPDGAELIVDDQLAFPTVVVGNVYILPGIPELFQAKIVSLRDRFRARPYFLRQVLVRDNETRIAEFLNATLVAFPELLLGSYPKLTDPDYRVLLTLESKDESYVDRALADLVGRLPAGCVFRIDGGRP